MEWVIFFIVIIFFSIFDNSKKSNKYKKSNKRDSFEQIIQTLEKQKDTLKQEKTKTEDKPVASIFKTNNKIIQTPKKQKDTLKQEKTKTEDKPVASIFKTNNKIIQKKVYNEEKVFYKSLHKNIIPYLNFKGVYKFYHFTDVKNLKSIIQYGGLYSWYGLETRQINSFLSSNQLSHELDTRYNLQDYIRLSFGSYHPMSSRLIHQEGKKLVWLEISLEVACFEQTLFSDINATDNNVKIGDSLDFLKTIDLDVFKYQYQYRDLDYNAKKKYQAEILVKKFLPIKYITNIDTLRKEQNL